jgi:TolA-binding protein
LKLGIVPLINAVNLKNKAMSKRIIAISVIGLIISSLQVLPLKAQHHWSLSEQRDPLLRPSSRSSSGGSNSNTISPAEVARRQRDNEATAANDKGLDFYKNQDWANAVVSFQEAVDKNPDDKVLLDNLAKATFANSN